jgi:hypothetical protein
MRGISLYGLVAVASGRMSEDYWGKVGDTAHGAAWVLDGATGLGDQQYSGHAYSDAAWYAQNFSKALADHSLSGLPVADIFSAALEQVLRAWQATGAPHDIPRYAMPTAAGIWVRWRGDALETVSLGDCRGWAVTETSSSQLGTCDDDPNDAWLAERIAELQANGTPPDAMRAAVMPVLREARSRMNQPDGYMIFGLQPEIAPELPVRQHPLQPGEIVLCSDGLFRWSDVLHCGTGTAFAKAAVVDIHSLAATVRQMESDDKDCIKFTRLKRHDDATGMVLRVQ